MISWTFSSTLDRISWKQAIYSKEASMAGIPFFLTQFRVIWTIPMKIFQNLNNILPLYSCCLRGVHDGQSFHPSHGLSLHGSNSAHCVKHNRNIVLMKTRTYMSGLSTQIPVFPFALVQVWLMQPWYKVSPSSPWDNNIFHSLEAEIGSEIHLGVY